MTAQETLALLNAHGLRVTLDPRNARIVINGPRAAYSEELRAAVAAQRDGILEALSAGVAGNAGVALPHNAGAHGKTNCSLNIPSSFGDRETPAKPATPADASAVQLAEIASLPVALTRDLPAPYTLVVRLWGRSLPSAFTCSAARAAAERRAQRAAWSPGEYEMAAYAVQEGRAFADDLARWDERKALSAGGWALGPRDAIGGAVALLEHQGKKLDGGRIPEGALTITWGAFLESARARLIEAVTEIASALPSSADEATL